MLPESQIGPTIKKIRNSLHLTLEVLAQRTGFTKGYLSKVEHSEKAPPVSTLIVIAKVLGVTISQILGEENTLVSCSVVKADERLPMARNGVNFGYSYETLAHPFPNKKMEPYILTIPAGTEESAVFQHDGQEMLLVLEGTMKFNHGGQSYLLESGDCIYFDSAIPHYGLPADDQTLKMLMVIYIP